MLFANAIKIQKNLIEDSCYWRIEKPPIDSAYSQMSPEGWATYLLLWWRRNLIGSKKPSKVLGISERLSTLARYVQNKYSTKGLKLLYGLRVEGATRLLRDELFPSRTKRKSLDLRTQLESGLKQSDIRDFRWHDLRHSCCSYMVWQGLYLRLMAELLSYRTLQMPMRYSHRAKERLKSAIC